MLEIVYFFSFLSAATFAFSGGLFLGVGCCPAFLPGGHTFEFWGLLVEGLGVLSLGLS